MTAGTTPTAGRTQDGMLSLLLSRACRCGHDRGAHSHYGPGRECSLCRPCTRFRRSWRRGRPASAERAPDGPETLVRAA